MPRTTARLALVPALAAVLACSPAARASDFAHTCTTADNRFEILDDTLVARADARQNAIPYEVLEKAVTSERRGYCVAAGKQYGFEARNYTMRIRFTYGGSTIETTATCEFASDGLPAAYNCEREVVTFESGSRPQAGGATLWSHNGSLMRLEADGATRRFVYDTPRAGMVAAGARPGDAVFEGQRDGATYVGEAYIFSKACGRVPYPVAGNVSADQRSVVLEGQAPRLGDDCRARSYRRDVLRFDFLGQ